MLTHVRLRMKISMRPCDGRVLKREGSAKLGGWPWYGPPVPIVGQTPKEAPVLCGRITPASLMGTAASANHHPCA